MQSADVIPVPCRLDRAAAGALARLENICFPDGWDETTFAAALVRPVFAAWGITGEEGLLAYMTVHLLGDELEILNIAVTPDLRGRGVGTWLLGHVLQETDKMGMNRGYLEVRAGNEPAKRLYLRHGFTVVGRRDRYYADTGEDALVMARALAPTDEVPDRSNL